MLIKIRDRIFDTNKDPIVLYFSNKDKENIKDAIDKDAKKMFIGPDTFGDNWIKGYMDDDRINLKEK